MEVGDKSLTGEKNVLCQGIQRKDTIDKKSIKNVDLSREEAEEAEEAENNLTCCSRSSDCDSLPRSSTWKSCRAPPIRSSDSRFSKRKHHKCSPSSTK